MSQKIQHHDTIKESLVDSEHLQIAAIYDTAEDAQRSAEELSQDSGISRRQIVMINPDDTHYGEKLEGSSRAIGKTMWNSHLLLGTIGLLAGLAAAFLLVTFGPALTQQNPLFTYIALISPGIFVGLFFAGLVSLRPDRTEIIDAVRHAMKTRHYALVVNLKKNQSAAKVAEVLKRKSSQVVEAIH
ncbi:hypothetical protein [Alteromonas ponticola]|uniref:Riboflavin biosynthesis protein RibA n=1 Tax=Alteromonas ponticola TaxID=2720613 RepID=A0ABX1QXK0_9ALTE|nr:hypothetical protein [Alteromonas ponticola]NMH58569.1 hypothetical protein [Alteromonas ponticola]